MPDNTLRKTQRHRLVSDTTERRKSRRHSTDTSPSMAHYKLMQSPKSLTPTYGALDEDSSGSFNSNELSGGANAASNGMFGDLKGWFYFCFVYELFIL